MGERVDVRRRIFAAIPSYDRGASFRAEEELMANLLFNLGAQSQGGLLRIDISGRSRAEISHRN